MEMPLDVYDGVPYPHPYLEIWMECRRHCNALGVPALPQPELGILDQDADLMLGFEVLEELAEERKDEEERREKNKQAAQQYNFGLPFDPEGE
jgi:hypothetical protein